MKKIAVSYDNGQIFQHFGKTETFRVYETDDGQVTGSALLASGETGHGALAGLLAEICGKPALFTDERLTEDEIPEGMYLYHLRERDDGDGFATLEAKVKVNHGGSVITNEPIALGEDGYIALSDENYPNFMGDTRTLAAFMGGDFPSQGLGLTM